MHENSGPGEIAKPLLNLLRPGLKDYSIAIDCFELDILDRTFHCENQGRFAGSHREHSDRLPTLELHLDAIGLHKGHANNTYLMGLGRLKPNSLCRRIVVWYLCDVRTCSQDIKPFCKYPSLRCRPYPLIYYSTLALSSESFLGLAKPLVPPVTTSMETYFQILTSGSPYDVDFAL